MNRNAIRGYGPLAVAFAMMFIMVDTSIVRGQRNDGDLVFEAPVPVREDSTFPQESSFSATNSAQGPRSNGLGIRRPMVTQAGGLQRNANQLNRGSARGIQPGNIQTGINPPGNTPSARTPSPSTQTSVTQVSGTLSSPRSPITGTEPKRLIPPTTTQSIPYPTPLNQFSTSSIPAGTTPIQNGQFVNQTGQLPNQSTYVTSAQGAVTTGSNVTTVGHYDPLRGITPDGGDPANQRRQKVPVYPPMQISPSDRGVQSTVRGNVLGLNPGETATEKCFQLQSILRELEQQNEELRQQNSGLQSRIKEREEQMLAAIREIKAARKELGLAKNDLERSKKELQTLQEKVRTAEREHSAVLQSMGPLLQQLLESDDVGSMPRNPVE